MINSNNGSVNVLKQDLIDIERLTNDHFEIKGENVRAKSWAKISTTSKQIPWLKVHSVLG